MSIIWSLWLRRANSETDPYKVGFNILQGKKVKVIKRTKGVAVIFPVLLGMFVFFFPFIPAGCGENRETGFTLPPFTSNFTEKGISKLDSQLNQLIEAAKHGEQASFAQLHNIEIKNGNIRVVIECVPGRLEDVKKAAIDIGAEVEATFEDLLQVSASMDSLTALAKDENIKFIRLPLQPVPFQSTNTKSLPQIPGSSEGKC